MNFLIVGGTGTLGKELVLRFYPDHKITILSRDEFKQSQMKRMFPKIDFILGDISNKEDLVDIDFTKFDYVFHCAALKHVDLSERNIKKFIDVNFNGTKNLADLTNKKTKLIFFSTDKAVMPINVYGMTKALAEKYVIRKSISNIVFRWGNILGSRGSIISTFAELIKAGATVSITDKEATRFWLTIDEAIDFVLENYRKTVPSNQIFIPHCKASKVTNIALAIGKILEKPVKIEYTTLREGEKVHEVLSADNDNLICSSDVDHYTIQELVEKIKYLVIKWKK